MVKPAMCPFYQYSGVRIVACRYGTEPLKISNFDSFTQVTERLGKHCNGR